ncbi:hypothetical protein ACFLZH_04150 [Patescibacteria group bacterium]
MTKQKIEKKSVKFKDSVKVVVESAKRPKEIEKKHKLIKKLFSGFFKINKPDSFVDTDALLTQFAKYKKKINFADPDVIKVISKSKIPSLKAIGARYAVKAEKKELEQLYLDDDDPQVIKELSKTKNPETALKLAENPNTSGETLDSLKNNLFKNLYQKNASIALKAILAIINHSNVFRNTIKSMVYLTRNYSIISSILRCRKLSIYIVTAVVERHYSRPKILLLALKTRRTIKKHFLFAIKKSNNPLVIAYSAKQKYAEVLETLVALNKGVNLVFNNPYLTGASLINIALKNNNLAILKKALMHPKGVKNIALWNIILKSSEGKNVLNFFLTSKNTKQRLIIAQSYSEKLNDEQFKKLLNDPDPAVQNALKNHKNEQVRVRVSKLTTDENFLLDKASLSRSTKVKVAIAKRAKLSKDVELSLISKFNKQVFLALAKKPGQITPETELALVKSKDRNILIALSKRATIKQKEVLNLLAASGIEEVELILFKKYKNLDLQKLIVDKTKSIKTLLFALETGHIEIRIALAKRNYSKQRALLKEVATEVLKDPQSRVRAALLLNRTFLAVLWEVLHDETLQTQSNPFFFIFKKMQSDPNALVKERLKKLTAKLTSTQKEGIKKWVIKE